MKITRKFKCFLTTGYTRPVTTNDGNAAGGVIHYEVRRSRSGLRLRETASTGFGRDRSKSYHIEESEFKMRFGNDIL
jgi:hypothetical protein